MQPDVSRNALIFTAVLSSSTLQCVQKKRRPKCFSVISSTKLGRLRWNLLYSFLSKFAAKMCKHFPPLLNNVYTLPCETWKFITQVLPMHCQRKKLQNLFHLIYDLRPPNPLDLNPVDYSVWEYCKRRCTKHASLMWINWNSDWEVRTEWSKLNHVVIAAAIRQWRRR